MTLKVIGLVYLSSNIGILAIIGLILLLILIVSFFAGFWLLNELDLLNPPPPSFGERIRDSISKLGASDAFKVAAAAIAVALPVLFASLIALGVLSQAPVIRCISVPIIEERLCLPSDPGGHIVIRSNGSSSGIPAIVSLYRHDPNSMQPYSTANPNGCPFDENVWKHDSSVIDIKNHVSYTLVTSDILADTTPHNPDTTYSGILGTYTWYVEAAGCYAVHVEPVGSSSHLPESTSPVVADDPAVNSHQSNLNACYINESGAWEVEWGPVLGSDCQ